MFNWIIVYNVAFQKIQDFLQFFQAFTSILKTFSSSGKSRLFQVFKTLYEPCKLHAKFYFCYFMLHFAFTKIWITM